MHVKRVAEQQFPALPENNMLSVERVKELLKDPNISDEEAEKIRDEFYIFAEMIFDKWMDEREKVKNNEKKEEPKI